MKFRIEIDTDNAAFGEINSNEYNYELRRVLLTFTDYIGGSGFSWTDWNNEYPLRDVNGNEVGFATGGEEEA